VAGNATCVLLGAGGAISTVLAPILVARGDRVKLVSRGGRSMPGTDAVRADLLDAHEVADAVEEGSTVFELAGLCYDAAVWEEQWPRIMRNTSDACEGCNPRLASSTTSTCTAAWTPR
jgi:nucleoside-diphosphate-sugar epimerase